jgi:hypothetical protein
MRPPQVLHEQAALKEYVASAPYRRFLQRFMESVQRTNGQMFSQDVIDRYGADFYGDFTGDMISNSLGIAQAFHVASDMTPLVNAAEADLEGTEYLTHEHLPAEHGFLIFDEERAFIDVWGDTITYRAIQWMHGAANGGRPGIWIWFYTDAHTTGDDGVNRWREKGVDVSALKLGRWHVVHLGRLGYGERIGPGQIPVPEDYAQHTKPGAKPMATVGDPHRAVLTVMLLLNQVLVEVREEPLDRATRRQMARKRIPASVQTISLRRKEFIGGPPSEGEGHVEWHHRWVVRGHWAWRHCGADHPLAEEYEKGYRARIYIAPHWKGPEDAPIKITEKVWSLNQ